MVTVEDFRLESDTMGQVKVPNSAYYGATTVRGIENFPISGLRFQTGFIEALALVKLAAAKANMQLNLLDKKKGDAIVSAANAATRNSYTPTTTSTCVSRPTMFSPLLSTSPPPKLSNPNYCHPSRS